MSIESTNRLLSLATGRRSILKGTAAAGLAAAAAGLLGTGGAWAEGSSPDDAHTIFSIARTAEQLAVTFYTNGVMNASALGLSGTEVDDLKAALMEEQIHLYLFAAQGGDSLVDTFSFPNGSKTFTDLATFIANQQLLEGAFDAAFISAVLEFAQMGQPRVAQIACQIAMIESEHRVLGRAIARRHGITELPNTTTVNNQGGLNSNGTIPTDPADNWAFAPALLSSVGQAPGVLKKFGYLGPNATYAYKPAIDQNGGDLLGLGLSSIYSKLMFTTPFAAPAASGSTGPSSSSESHELKDTVSGALTGNGGGAFDNYTIRKPGTNAVTLTLTYAPHSPANGNGIGLEVYQNGARLASGTDTGGTGTLSVTVTPSGDDAMLVKVDNYINGQTVNYTLARS